jgi:hypothetical protein
MVSMPGPPRVCHYHSDRPGIGVCMRCRVVICAACCTRVEGVNHCHACLKKLGARRERPSSGPRNLRFLTAGLLLGLGWLVLFGLFWLAHGLLDRLDH